MGVLANVFGGSGQFGGGPTAVQAQALTNEGFELTQPFIQDVLEASRAQFFEDVERTEVIYLSQLKQVPLYLMLQDQ